HSRGRLALGEVTELEHARTAVDAGADGLTHAIFDAVVDDAFVQAMRRHNTFAETTLATFDCGLGAGHLLRDPRERPLLSAWQVAALTSRAPYRPESWLDGGSQNIRLLYSAGVPIIAGTEAGSGLAADGASMLAELVRLVRSGLTPAQALTAATATPAREYR